MTDRMQEIADLPLEDTKMFGSIHFLLIALAAEPEGLQR